MKLIVGLGNPGTQYDKTRHNAGFMVIDRLAKRHLAGAIPKGKFNGSLVEGAIRGERCILFKPTTYMNRSGGAIAQAAGFYKIEVASDLLVIVDDVALPSGTIRLRAAGSAGGHNGLSDIQQALGTEAYPRCRIGIDATPAFMDQADYVLGRFTGEQWALVEPALEKAADASEVFISEGITPAMNRFNTRPPAPPAPPGPQPPPPPAGEAGPAKGGPGK